MIGETKSAERVAETSSSRQASLRTACAIGRFCPCCQAANAPAFSLPVTMTICWRQARKVSKLRLTRKAGGLGGTFELSDAHELAPTL